MIEKTMSLNIYKKCTGKKINALLCVLAAFASVFLASCSDGEQEGTAINISYLNKNETKLITETHYLTGETPKDRIVEVLTLLCSVPENKELRATLPNGINIVTYSYEGEQVTVSLGEKYRELPRTTEVLTRAAIVRSLTALPEVTAVTVNINGEPLTDSQGKPYGLMTADMFVDNAPAQVDDEGTNTVMLKLYFANEEGNGLIAINREMVYNADATSVSMERLVVEQLVSGPANDESYATINPNTKIQSVTVKDGVCYVSFDNSFLTAQGNVTSDVAIYSIVNSLVELSNVNKVQISIDGKTDVRFRDKYDLTTVFERNLSIMGEG